MYTIISIKARALTIVWHVLHAASKASTKLLIVSGIAVAAGRKLTGHIWDAMSAVSDAAYAARRQADSIRTERAIKDPDGFMFYVFGAGREDAE